MADGHDIISDYRVARSRIGLVPQELSTDAFACATVSFKDWYVVHARAPLLRIARSEAERHTAHRLRAVDHIGLAAGQRETADDGHTAGLEDDGLGKARALAVALEVSRDYDGYNYGY